MNKNNDSNKKKHKKIVSVILAFFLSFFAFLGAILIIIQSTILSPNYMRKQLGNSNYYENAIDEVENEFTSYAYASGFDQDFFKKVVDINDVQLNVNQSLSVLYGESNQPVNTSDFKNKLSNALLENVSDRKIAVTDNIKQSLNLLVQTCSDTYVQYISIPYYGEFSHIIKKVSTPIIVCEFIILFVIVLIAILIYKLNHWKHRAIRAYIYGISGSVLMLIVFPLLILISGITNRIALISKSMYMFAVCYINGILYSFLYCAVFFIIVALILAVTYYYLKKKAIHYSANRN